MKHFVAGMRNLRYSVMNIRFATSFLLYKKGEFRQF